MALSGQEQRRPPNAAPARFTWAPGPYLLLQKSQQGRSSLTCSWQRVQAAKVPEENHRAWLTCPLSSDFRDKVPATHAQDAEKDSVSAGEAAGSADALGRRQRSPAPALPQGQALPGWSPGTRLRLLSEANRVCAANSWEAAAFHCPSSRDWQERRSLGPWGDAAGNTCTRGRLALSGRSLS